MYEIFFLYIGFRCTMSGCDAWEQVQKLYLIHEAFSLCISHESRVPELHIYTCYYTSVIIFSI